MQNDREDAKRLIEELLAEEPTDEVLAEGVLVVVEHHEPATEIDAIEAEEVVALQYCTFIERGIATLIQKPRSIAPRTG